MGLGTQLRSRFQSQLHSTAEEEEGAEVAEQFRFSGGDLEEVHIDLDDEGTLVGEGDQGVKEVDIEITDDESGSDHQGAEGDRCGVKRRRTIRVVIRSRAFL